MPHVEPTLRRILSVQITQATASMALEGSSKGLLQQSRPAVVSGFRARATNANLAIPKTSAGTVPVLSQRRQSSSLRIANQPRKEWAVLANKCTLIAAFAAGFALSACATSPSSSADSPSASNAEASAPVAQRDLTPQEKKVIADAVMPSLRDTGSAKYRWAKFPTVIPDGGSVNYCATVDAKSPYAAYSGRQEYIVEAKVVNGKVSAAVMGLIAGGKDAALVGKMCAKYGLDPNNAS
jgi:hypothetical protein